MQTPATKAKAAALAAAAARGDAPKPRQGGGTGENSHYCNGCTPPLVYAPGAPIVDTSGDDGLTITPIFWNPTGKVASSAQYRDLITQYITDVAADSETNTNVYSLMPEYYQTDDEGNNQTNLRYKITAGTPIIDTNPYPARRASCKLSSSKFRNCVTDAQLRTEVSAITADLDADKAHFYPVFFAPDTETYDLDLSNSVSGYCGYHRAFNDGDRFIDYGNEPYETSGCGDGQSPNGMLAADASIGTLSHEITEAMTDPTDTQAWHAVTGQEIGDLCNGYYGPPLGTTDDGAKYNQVINGDYYYTQTEFSNAAYQRNGVGGGCVRSESEVNDPGAVHAADVPVVGSLVSDPFPNVLDADGVSTSDIDNIVVTPDGFGIAGDEVSYDVYAIEGEGDCGTISADAATTDAGGHSHVTYTASTDDAECAVVATEVDGGQSVTGIIYQGAFQSEAVRAEANYPASLTLGAKPIPFTVTFTNPGSEEVIHTRIHLQLTPDDGTTENINADQVALDYSTTGPSGPFTPVDLKYSTVTEGAIQADVLPLSGVTIPAASTLSVDFRIALKDGISTARGGAGFAMESYLDQINLADGAISTVGDTLGTSVAVLGPGTPPTTPPPTTPPPTTPPPTTPPPTTPVTLTPPTLSATSAFVTAAYTDFLGRPPTPVELVERTAAIDGGTLTRAALVQQLATSTEWISGIVNHLYADTLGRPGDTAGVAYWTQQIQTRTATVAEVASRFYASPEYFNGLGGGTTPTWIIDLYNKILHRTPDAAGIEYWASQVTAKGRVAVAFRFYQSNESRHYRVNLLYVELLGRAPDASGANYWADKILRAGDVTLASDLAATNEYFERAHTRFP